MKVYKDEQQKNMVENKLSGGNVKNSSSSNGVKSSNDSQNNKDM